ncbi:MAG: hypothetical protein ACYDDS_14555 [Candidatus Sulfotelmatobacter sp.]
MNAVQNVTMPGQARQPALVPQRQDSKGRQAVFFLYALMLFACTYHLYRTPIYSMDSIQYMGNALLMEERDPAEIHRRVYAEVQRSVPKVAREDLLGHRADAPEDQNKSRQERAEKPSRLAEFLPLFAIRPLYNQILWLTSKTGMGLVRAGVVISVGSYFLLGILLFVWIGKYINPWLSLAVSLLLMISPPLTALGRDTTADALASLVAFASLYLIFEENRLLPGMVALLVSIYFRTDFVVLAGPVILTCWWQKRLELWKAAVLSVVAVASVLCINHFAGDYGIKMLYYRNFVGVPVAPGEMTVQFSFRDYMAAMRSGITLAANSFFIPLLLVGMFGVVSRRMRPLFAVTLAYVVLHFLVLPNWQERWVGVFYLSMGVCAATVAGAAARNRLVSADAAE